MAADPAAMTRCDTICAIATPPGRSGVGIVRLSGNDCQAIASAVIGKLPAPRYAHYGDFKAADGSVIDQGIALYFPAPNSFTGEDVLEFQGHGGTRVLHALLDRMLELGARLAHAGEFSERAFLNNKIDLLQAEAIADLIEASSEQAMRSAMRTLQGEFSKVINTLVADLTRIRVNVEAAIDFSDEDIDVMADTGVADAVDATLAQVREIYGLARQGALLKEGIQVVIAGKPNAGKSSLLNALSGQDTAIVTDVAGTTRDLLRQDINLDGLPIHITDTAGLRLTEDVVEKEGVRRARQAMAEADQILLVVDSETASADLADTLSPLLVNQHALTGQTHVGPEQDALRALLNRTTLIFNKVDRLPNQGSAIESTSFAGQPLTVIHLSAREGDGIDLLARHLQQQVGYSATEESAFVARQRHLEALGMAEEHLLSARRGLNDQQQLELIAEDLRLAQRELGRITGEVTSDDLLGEIFSSFCVGK